MGRSSFGQGIWLSRELSSNGSNHRFHRSMRKVLRCTDWIWVYCCHHFWPSVFWCLEECFLANDRSFSQSSSIQQRGSYHYSSSSHRRLLKNTLTVRIELNCSFIKLKLEISAASWLRISLAWSLVNWYDFWVNESSIDHVFIGAGLKGFEGHDSVANYDGFEVYLLAFAVLIVQIYQNC